MMSSTSAPTIKPQPGTVEDLDALIVGAGFGGVYQLRRLRQEGYKAKLVDSASDFGGVWYWNRYPGARVDSSIPLYEFSDAELWREWSWSQRFPGSEELRAYFRFVAQKWDLQRDTYFNTLSALRHGMTMKQNGIDKFKGTWLHPSYWPEDELDLKGKRVAVIGTGSMGIQLAQELSKVAGEFVLFQRTPNMALPMKQVEYVGDEQAFSRDEYARFMEDRLHSFGGMAFNFVDRLTFDDTPEQRQAFYQQLWNEGDFHFWLAGYKDTLFDWDANAEAYTFWRDKVRARIRDPNLQEVLAPTVQPHAFGCKRVSLENKYYEIFSESHVSLVDVKSTPIVEVTENGIRTTEKEWNFDCIICATGYDAITGGLNEIDIRGKSGQKLKDKWTQGVRTFLGMAVAGFPNMFFTCGPQAPTALCNGPTCAELQGEWILHLMNYMRQTGSKSAEAREEAEKTWAESVKAIANMSLLPTAKSWYMGDNIPGKVREPLIYLGGVPTYYKTVNECAADGYAGFHLA
ncbi:hypothetical protein LTR20_011125 [Exophiala xenobiotica]|nr:hypothetical protein LTR93_011206 [Exophiala xenobiotica]KAK5358398.1 hypothetical protein LTS13_010949 [Exophiala xenobiotica]KAK5394066.1 hypothetical protein LTR79_008279 [Exophiala xenobiotica]KAK5405161.1 hypothetical protein LTR90_011084 [Exophiala xenobiotica]KAK5452506.1 hypothetical protein LTR20_011125 [Exophiala xenobiotica]